MQGGTSTELCQAASLPGKAYVPQLNGAHFIFDLSKFFPEYHQRDRLTDRCPIIGTIRLSPDRCQVSVFTKMGSRLLKINQVRYRPFSRVQGCRALLASDPRGIKVQRQRPRSCMRCPMAATRPHSQLCGRPRAGQAASTGASIQLRRSKEMPAPTFPFLLSRRLPCFASPLAIPNESETPVLLSHLQAPSAQGCCPTALMSPGGTVKPSGKCYLRAISRSHAAKPNTTVLVWTSVWSSGIKAWDPTGHHGAPPGPALSPTVLRPQSPGPFTLPSGGVCEGGPAAPASSPAPHPSVGGGPSTAHTLKRPGHLLPGNQNTNGLSSWMWGENTISLLPVPTAILFSPLPSNRFQSPGRTPHNKLVSHQSWTAARSAYGELLC